MPISTYRTMEMIQKDAHATHTISSLLRSQVHANRVGVSPRPSAACNHNVRLAYYSHKGPLYLLRGLLGRLVLLALDEERRRSDTTWGNKLVVKSVNVNCELDCETGRGLTDINQRCF